MCMYVTAFLPEDDPGVLCRKNGMVELFPLHCENVAAAGGQRERGSYLIA